MERERGGSMSSDSVFTEAGMRLLSMNITMPAQRLTGVLIPENSLENQFHFFLLNIEHLFSISRYRRNIKRLAERYSRFKKLILFFKISSEKYRLSFLEKQKKMILSGIVLISIFVLVSEPKIDWKNSHSCLKQSTRWFWKKKNFYKRRFMVLENTLS